MQQLAALTQDGRELCSRGTSRHACVHTYTERWPKWQTALQQLVEAYLGAALTWHVACHWPRDAASAGARHLQDVDGREVWFAGIFFAVLSRTATLYAPQMQEHLQVLPACSTCNIYVWRVAAAWCGDVLAKVWCTDCLTVIAAKK